MNTPFLPTTNQTKTKDTVVKTKHNSLSRISFSSGLALALAFAMWLPNAARSAEHKGDMGGMNMNPIKTQAGAEALKPGDSMSMTLACSP